MTTNQADEHPLMGPGRGRLEGKVAIVTGADSGIGRATARLFAREGARVLCADVTESGMQRIDRLIAEDGGQAAFFQADVTSRSECDAMVAAALEQFGDLDILVNNAGSGVRGGVAELTDDQWTWLMNTNMNSVFHCSRAALEHFIPKQRGNIVNMASSLGILVTPQYAAYCASKAAVINMTRTMALDYGPGIRVNCVCPGVTDTPRIRRQFAASGDLEGAIQRAAENIRVQKRMARPEEIAYPMLFLASDESSFVTGHAFVVDGGQTIDA
jgi:3-oxoacyl-[acyl-carrier protein] reductase